MLGSVVSAQTEGASGVEVGVGNDPGSTEFEVPQTFSSPEKTVVVLSNMGDVSGL